MIIPWAVSCEGREGEGGDFYTRKREKNRPNDERETRSKELAFRKDWKAQIMRSARRSSVLKSIYTIHALGCQVHTADPRTPTYPEPYSAFLLHRKTLSGFP